MKRSDGSDIKALLFIWLHGNKYVFFKEIKVRKNTTEIAVPIFDDNSIFPSSYELPKEIKRFALFQKFEDCAHYLERIENNPAPLRAIGDKER